MVDQELMSIDMEKELSASFKKKVDVLNKESERTSKLKEKFSLIRRSWRTTITEHAQRFGSLENLVGSQVGLFSDRQRLVEEIYDFQEKIEKVSRQVKTNRQHFFEKFENDRNSAKIKSYQAISLLIEGEMAELDEQLNLMSNHYSYLTETLKTMDFLLYSVKSRISLEEYK